MSADTSPIKDFPAYARALGGQLKAFRAKNPELMGSFGKLHAAAAKDGALSARVKELMALAIGVATRCDGCIAFHLKDALKAGATPEEVHEALGVAVLMGGGPALMYAMHALEALEVFSGESPAG